MPLKQVIRYVIQLELLEEHLPNFESEMKNGLASKFTFLKARPFNLLAERTSATARI
jgi:hypothetical protein